MGTLTASAKAGADKLANDVESLQCEVGKITTQMNEVTNTLQSIAAPRDDGGEESTSNNNGSSLDGGGEDFQSQFIEATYKACKDGKSEHDGKIEFFTGDHPKPGAIDPPKIKGVRFNGTKRNMERFCVKLYSHLNQREFKSVATLYQAHGFKMVNVNKHIYFIDPSDRFSEDNLAGCKQMKKK